MPGKTFSKYVDDVLIAEAITITNREEATSSRGGLFVGYFSQEGLPRVNVSLHGGAFFSFPRFQER